MPDTRNLKLRGTTWWFVKIHKGREIAKSLDTGNLGVAQGRRDRTIAELRAQGGERWGERRKCTFEVVAERFAKEHFPVLKPTSAKRYFVSLKKLIPHFGGMQLDAIRSSALSDFEALRRKEGVTASSIRRDLSCMSVIFTLAEAWELTDRNPVKPFLFERRHKGLKEGAARTRWLSHEEEGALLDALGETGRKAVVFAIDTGLRKGEQITLPWANIDFAKAEVFVSAEFAKSGVDRRVPILPRTLAMLRTLHAERGTSPYVFNTYQGRPYTPNSPTLWELLQKGAKKAGISDHLEWHDLRRTCGCRLLQDHGLAMHEVSDWLGHSDTKVTEDHYAFLTVNTLHKALKRGHAATAHVRVAR